MKNCHKSVKISTEWWKICISSYSILIIRISAKFHVVVKKNKDQESLDGWTCLQDEVAKSVNKNSCMLHDKTVLFIVSYGVPGQLNYLP